MYKNPPTLSRVPGDLNLGRDTEKQGYIRDMSKLSKTELLDLKLRQDRLLNNKGLISKLPDKGAKIRSFYERILKQLEAHNNADRAAKLKKSRKDDAEQRQSLECAPADLIGVNVAKVDDKLKTNSEKRQQAKATELFSGHALYICGKERSTEARPKFLPSRTTKSNPPSLKHALVKFLTLEESIRLQAEKHQLLEDIRKQQVLDASSGEEDDSEGDESDADQSSDEEFQASSGDEDEEKD